MFIVRGGGEFPRQERGYQEAAQYKEQRYRLFAGCSNAGYVREHNG